VLTAEIVFGLAVVVSTLAAAASARRDRQAAERARDKAQVIHSDLIERERTARAAAAPVILPFPQARPRLHEPPRPGAV